MDVVHINLYGVAIYGTDSSFTFINKIVSHIKLTAKELHSIKHIVIVTHKKDALGIPKDALGMVRGGDYWPSLELLKYFKPQSHQDYG